MHMNSNTNIWAISIFILDNSGINKKETNIFPLSVLCSTSLYSLVCTNSKAVTFSGSGSGGRTVVWQLEGCWFDPCLRLAKNHRCHRARHL